MAFKKQCKSSMTEFSDVSGVYAYSSFFTSVGIGIAGSRRLEVIRECSLGWRERDRREGLEYEGY